MPVPPQQLGDGDAGRRPDPSRPNVMAVHTELVKEYLLDSMFDEVMDRYPGDIPEPAATAFQGTLAAVLGEERTEGAAREAAELANGLARAGYLTRLVETERFERAREPTPELAETLSGEWFPRAAASWPDAVIGMSAELARSEPSDKPQPGDEQSMSWTVKGPGGHVRHFLALRAATALASRGPDDRPRMPQGLEGAGELKRCWMYGFYMRCCEESLPPDASLEAGGS